MRTKRLFLGSVFLLTLNFAFSAHFDLKSLYEKALENDLANKVQESYVAESKESVVNTRSALLPQVNVAVTKAWADVDRKKDLYPEISAEQKIFAGGRYYKLFQEAEHNGKSREYDLRAYKRDLFVSISNLYFDILALQRELNHVQQLLKIFDKRISELNSRVRIGKSRRAEFVAVQTQQRIANAEEFALQTNIKSKRLLLSQITDLPPGVELKEDFKTKFVVPKVLELDRRPDVQSLNEKSLAAQARVQAERSTFWPQLSASGTFYPNGNIQDDENKWQLALRAQWRLWDSFETSSRVGESIQERARAELQNQILRKQINSDYQNLLSIMAAAEQQLAALEEGVKFAELNNRLQVEDYSRGVISTLDVLQTLDALINAQRSHDRKLAEVNKSYYELLSISGDIPL